MANDRLKALIAEAATRHRFRQRGPFEGAEQYAAALITHLENEDWAMAHEVRVGRRQADWTPEDVESFRQRMLGRHRRPRPDVHKEVHAAEIPMVIEDGRFTLSEDAMVGLAHQGLASMTRMRKNNPGRSLLIMVSAMLSTGKMITAAVNRDDRVSLLKHMAKEVPVYGYLVVADTFVHHLPVAGQPGLPTKQDALVAHVGTREIRRMIVRPYTYSADRTRVTFDPNPPPDVDKRGPGVEHDPYAEIFTAPSSDRVQ
jgi:hypothetical protein